MPNLKIQVWYHCKLSGGGIPDPDAAAEIAAEQLNALGESGLGKAASEVHLGINGDHGDGLVLGQLIPPGIPVFLHVHGSDDRWEHPTLSLLQRYLKPGQAVLYHHSKGVTQPKDAFHHLHRRTMEHYLVWNWRRCVRDLERGYEVAGINLVDEILRPVLPGRFFAGNFWWARSDWLMKLAKIDPNDRNRLTAEWWVCNHKGQRPMAIDYERPDLDKWCRSLVRA